MIRRSFSSRGSILIIVLWISLGLAAIALTFAHTSFMAYKGSDNELAGQQADWAIEGGARYVMDLLANTTTPGQMLDPDTFEAEALPVGEATIWLLGGSGDDTSYTSTTPVFGLVDEASKININITSPELSDMLMQLPGMTQELADAIVDWRDENDDVSGSGAESETYSLRRPAYVSKNKPFESIEELALVNGATFEVLYGEDANMNGVLDPNEDDGEESAPVDNADGKLEPGVLQYLTCYSRESNLQSDGTTKKVDVSTLSLNPDLPTLLSTTFELNRASEIQANLTAAGALNPAAFKSVLEFYLKGQMTPDELGQIIDQIWIKPEDGKTYVEGLINVNTASETVLACIPGIGPDKASSVVAARQQRAQVDSNIAWVADALGEDDAELAGPFITGRTFQVSADIAAVGRHGRGYRRTRFVIDTTTGTPRIVYRRDLSSLGWALGSTTRQTLALQKEEPPR